MEIKLSTYIVTPEDAAMDRRAILDRLSAPAPGLKVKYGVESLAVFGSMARGDDLKGKAAFGNSMGLKLDLEDLFGGRVDLGTPNTLRPATRARVEKEAIDVA